MEIKYFDGDVLTSTAPIIMHQVNCKGVMNSGIATDICIYDINTDKALGEVMDLVHGTSFVKPVNIYAGSLSDVGSAVADVPNEYSGNVSITIEKDASGFGKIFAHGARENRDGGYPDEWKSSADLYKVSGDVNIFLHTCKNIVVDDIHFSGSNPDYKRGLHYNY